MTRLVCAALLPLALVASSFAFGRTDDGPAALPERFAEVLLNVEGMT